VPDPSQNQAEYRQLRFASPPGAANLFLVRHGETQPAREDAPFPLRDGHADPPLDPRGREEAERVAERLAGQDLSAIYVTPLRRTAETAGPLAERLGIQPLVEPNLREVYLGEWEGGLFRVRVHEKHPIARRMYAEGRWDVIPGAETLDSLGARVRAGIARIATAHPGERVAVFTHGGVIGMAVALATQGRPFAFIEADNGSITQLVVGDRWILRRFNDTGHLGIDLHRPADPLT